MRIVPGKVVSATVSPLGRNGGGAQLLQAYAGEFSASAHREESAPNSLTRGQLGWWMFTLTPPRPVKALREAVGLIPETFMQFF